LLEEMKKLGLFGITIPKDYGGLGFDLTDYLYLVSVMAETDMSLAIIPLGHLSIGVKGIILFGNDEQKKKYLPQAADGSMIFAYALTEPKIGSDAKHIETTAEPSKDGNTYTLNGTKAYITNGGYAGGLTVFAQIKNPKKDEPEMGAFIVETDWEGVEVGDDMPKMGLHTSSTTIIRLNDVSVPRENLLSAEGEGFKIAMTILNYGRLGLGAASAGITGRSAEEMTKRGKTRKQFGKPIGEFELIQEKIGNAKIREQQIRALTGLTTELLKEEPLGNVALESSHTKLLGTTEAWTVLYDALQTAGGAGYLSTQPYEKRMRDFRVTTVFEGTTEIHSIYPALSLIREVNKNIKGNSRFMKFITLQLFALKPAKLTLPSNPHLNAGLKRKIRRGIKRLIKAIRKKIVYGMIHYGKNIVEKEFFLRRITRLSLTLYTLIALSFLLNQSEEKETIKKALLFTLKDKEKYLSSGKSEIARESLTLKASQTAEESE
jgi:acyl-CoA dehydrogenase family protein 9